MQLTPPQPYHGDPGRSLSEEERREVAKTVTPIDKIASRTCKVESTNDKWRLGKV